MNTDWQAYRREPQNVHGDGNPDRSRKGTQRNAKTNEDFLTGWTGFTRFQNWNKRGRRDFMGRRGGKEKYE